MKIGIAFDLAPTDPALRSEGPDDRFEEFDKPETVEAIAEVIRGEGHEVVLLGDGREFLARVLADPPDFVFNIAEGEGVGRCREARVPAALEMLGIPYTGSDPLTLAACLDKSVAKTLVSPNRSPGSYTSCNFVRMWVDVPHGVLLDSKQGGDGFLVMAALERIGEGRPVILKPAFEGSSKGIRGTCVAQTGKEACSIFERLARDYGEPILIEEFIEGDELTVGMIGNQSAVDVLPDILGVMRIKPRKAAERFVYSLEVKRDWANQVEYEAPALLSDLEEAAVRGAALSAYQALGCRDVARIDFRVRDGVPYFIEANPLPGLAPGTSDLVILAQGHGIEYPDLIRKILHAAFTRLNLS